MINFHIHIILCVVDFTKSKYVQYVMKKALQAKLPKKLQAKLPKNLFEWCQLGFGFHIFFIEIAR